MGALQTLGAQLQPLDAQLETLGALHTLGALQTLGAQLQPLDAQLQWMCLLGPPPSVCENVCLKGEFTNFDYVLINYAPL